MNTNLHFVFLQGMPSPFFRRIADRLAAAGCRVTGINFCFGDRLFWGDRDAVDYRGSLAAWPRFFADFLGSNAVTDIVLLGEQRNYHKPAVALAKARGIRVTVTDFGYLRPDWITLEPDGMCGNSTFPREPERIRRIAASVPKADLTARFTDSVEDMSRADQAYHWGNLLRNWRYPRYRRSDMRPHPLLYYPFTALQPLRARLQGDRKTAHVSTLLASGARYFVFPLQLEHDFQIVAYSPFDEMETPIRMVIGSFAMHAGADNRLAIKVHPFDPGLRNWRRIIARLAKAHGVADRIDYFDCNDLDEMIRGAAGMVTVNSTSGIRALQLGCPVKLLGQAMYDVPGLVFQGALDHFWSEAAPPDPALAGDFINAIAATIQIRGTFFSEPGLSAAVDAAAERLVSGRVGMTLGPSADVVA